MSSESTYQSGVDALDEIWRRVQAHETVQSTTLDETLRSSITRIMSPDSQIAQRYALPVQLLLKKIINLGDSRQLAHLFDADNDPLSSRSFAKFTVAAHPEIGPRLGASGDPYVSNPMRKSRMSDELLEGRGARVWRDVFNVLEYADAHPESVDDLLLMTLAEVRDRPPTTPVPPTRNLERGAKADLATLVDVAGAGEDGLILDILAVLESDQPQVVLCGPPGTGKTHLAELLAQHVAPMNHKVVQFHASYGYEEFIEGLRPTVNAGGAVEFAVTEGIVRRIAANLADGEKFVLILDEFNRANLPRVLGELLYALERREQEIDLMFTEGFKLPRGLMFIATMNTADRSIRTLDAAVRRRFQFFELGPDPKTLAHFYLSHPNEVPDLVEGFVALNDALTAMIDRHHTVGHTFFLDRRGMTFSRLRQTWTRQIVPLLEDYLFDSPSQLETMTIESFWPSIQTS